MGAMNELINDRAIATLVSHLEPLGPVPHVREVAAQFGDLALARRVALVSAALVDDFSEFPRLAAAVRGALDDPGFRGWAMWPVGEAVTTLALRDETDRFDEAMDLQAALTPRLTAEFSIRRLLQAHPERALDIVATWTSSADEHVRRLASEGLRPYLPWGIRVPAMTALPEGTIGILDELYRDESDYVRRSVANHLNDIARDHPQLVVETAERWMSAPDENTPWVARHALRTLIKKGFAPALAALGYGQASIAVSPPTVSERVLVPGYVDFAFDVTNTGDESARIAVDYVIHYVKSNGTLAAKVFKLTSATVAPGAVLRLTKRHALRQMTTRVHYAGAHLFEVQVNGVRFGATEFLVEL